MLAFKKPPNKPFFHDNIGGIIHERRQIHVFVSIRLDDKKTKQNEQTQILRKQTRTSGMAMEPIVGHRGYSERIWLKVW
jgi:hypothetical protein